MFLSCCYFFFFCYFCTATTIGTTTTITTSNVNEGKRDTRNKLQVVKFRVLELWSEEGVSNSKARFITSFRSWEHVHTHTHKVWFQYKIYCRWCNPTYICFPCTWVLKLAFGLCSLVCFWACSHVVNSPYNNFGIIIIIITWSRRKKILFSLLHAIIVELVDMDYSVVLLQSIAIVVCFDPFCLTSIVILSDVHHCFVQHLSPCRLTFFTILLDICHHSIQRLLPFRPTSINVRPLSFIHPAPFVNRHSSLTIHPRWHAVFLKLYVALEFCS